MKLRLTFNNEPDEQEETEENYISNPDSSGSSPEADSEIGALAEREKALSEGKSKPPAETESKSETPEELGAAESAAAVPEANEGFYNPSEDEPEVKRKSVSFLLWGSGRRKRNTITGGIIGLLIGGGFGGFFLIASGPFQAIQASQVLQGPFSILNHDSSLRLNKLFRYNRTATSGDIGETRVGTLGSKIFSSTMGQLSDVGIESKETP